MAIRGAGGTAWLILWCWCCDGPRSPWGLFAVLAGLLVAAGRLLADCWLAKIAENPWYYYVYMYVCICMLVCWSFFTFGFLCVSFFT